MYIIKLTGKDKYWTFDGSPLWSPDKYLAYQFISYRVAKDKSLSLKENSVVIIFQS